MRPLKAKDIGPFLKILSKMELKNTVITMFNGEKQQGEMISELVIGIIENYYKAEKEFFKFLADLEGRDPKEIADMPLDEFFNLITSLFSKENLPFLKLAAK